MKEEDYITAREVGLCLGVTRQRVCQLIWSGELEAKKISGVWIIKPASVRKYLEERARKDAGRGGK